MPVHTRRSPQEKLQEIVSDNIMNTVRTVERKSLLIRYFQIALLQLLYRHSSMTWSSVARNEQVNMK